MSTALSYGGWLTERTGTGGASSLVRWAGWITAMGAALTTIGTGGELSIEHLKQNAQRLQHGAPTVEMAATEYVRSSSEELAHIRKVLKPSISDLASTFGVSRQSVYNWLNGEQVARENAGKLHDLAQAVDVLVYAGIVAGPVLLKRKFSNGKTLLQVAQAGESARDAALLLAHVHKREAAQRERLNARFATRRRTAPSADFDLPASNDAV